MKENPLQSFSRKKARESPRSECSQSLLGTDGGVFSPSFAQKRKKYRRLLNIVSFDRVEQIPFPFFSLAEEWRRCKRSPLYSFFEGDGSESWSGWPQIVIPANSCQRFVHGGFTAFHPPERNAWGPYFGLVGLLGFLNVAMRSDRFLV